MRFDRDIDQSFDRVTETTSDVLSSYNGEANGRRWTSRV